MKDSGGIDPDQDPTFKNTPNPVVKKKPDPDPSSFRANTINFFLDIKVNIIDILSGP